MKMTSSCCYLALIFSLISYSVLANDKTFDLKGLKFKAGFLNDPAIHCTTEEEKMACFHRKSGSMFVFTVAPKESEDDFTLYAKALKNKKINLPLISKPLANEIFSHEKRQWIYSLHSNAEIPQYFTSYYLAVINQRVLLLSVTAKDESTISNFKKTSFKQLSLL